MTQDVALPVTTLSMGQTEARSLTDEVKEDAQGLWEKCLRLYQGGAHLALGYTSWGAYWKAEFGGSRSKGYRILKAARVVESLPESHAWDSVTGRQAEELAKVVADLSTIVDTPLPANEFQARALSRAVKGSEKRRAVGNGAHGHQILYEFRRLYLTICIVGSVNNGSLALAQSERAEREPRFPIVCLQLWTRVP